ncbi:MAG: DUF2911 domain-containing protein [Saprospiraceae bacterium]|nr:DUF2911 domain-containing protein [Saprospiraceae bacterium]
MKKLQLCALFLCAALWVSAQNLTQPTGGGNQTCGILQRVGITDIEIRWNAPGVKGREGKVWGTPVAHYGFQNLGFGTAKESPWRAGANENTTISFSTDVQVEGKPLAKGKYGFFIAVYPDSCTLIFSKSSTAWGSFFYKPQDDALRVTVRQQKNMPTSREWLGYEFSDPTENSAIVALAWEHWRIPFRVSVDLNNTVVSAMRRDLESTAGFVGSNWQQAANFCLQKNINLEEALSWADNSLGSFFGTETFTNYQTKADILTKLNRPAEAEAAMQKAISKATIFELHGYGRQLIADKKPAKAMEVFQANYKQNGDTWPTHVGLARGYSALGDQKKALEHAKIALGQAPDDLNKKNLESLIKTLSEGKAIN